jgi:carbamoyl-phosphate synthase large subunit
MASTGEVAAFGTDVHEAYWASLISTTGFKLPRANSGVLIGGDVSQPEMADVARSISASSCTARRRRPKPS